MGSINVNAIDKESGSTLTLGGAGTTVAVHASATTSGFDSGLASVQTFTSSGTWTKPSGITKINITIIGGGAGGAGATNQYGAGSGGAGGTVIKYAHDVSLISTATITIGSGGVGALSAVGTDGAIALTLTHL